MKVVLIADVPNWAFGNIARYVKRHSSHEVSILHSSDFPGVGELCRYLSVIDFDVCHFFWRLYYELFIDHVRSTGQFDGLLKKSYTISVPDYALLSPAFNTTNRTLSDSAAGILFTNDHLRQIYMTRFKPSGVLRTIHDPLLMNVDVARAKKAIEGAAGPMRIVWVGNSAWSGAGHYVDYKGYRHIWKSVEAELSGESFTFIDLDSSQQKRPHGEVIELLYSTHVLCMTSLFEGTSLPVLEAMATGNTILTTNTGIYPDVADAENKKYILRRNHRDFIAALRSLERDRNSWRDAAVSNLKAVAALQSTDLVRQWDEFLSDARADFRDDRILSVLSGRSAAEVSSEYTVDDHIVDAHCITTSRWFGVRNSTRMIFHNIVEVPFGRSGANEDFSSQDVVRAIEDSNRVRPIVISGGDDFHSRVFSEQLSFFRGRNTSILWHGSLTQWQEQVHYRQFGFWLDALFAKQIRGIAVFKEDVHEMLRMRGLNTFLLANGIPLTLNGNNALVDWGRAERLNFEKKSVRISVLSAANHPLKNPTTQIMSALLFRKRNIELILPDASEFDPILRRFRVTPISTGKGLSQEEHSRVAEMADLALYVTFTECSPMIPLECVQAGVPCIVSQAANIYRGHSELERFLVVRRADDAAEVAAHIQAVFENYPLVVRLCRDFIVSYRTRFDQLRSEYNDWLHSLA